MARSIKNRRNDDHETFADFQKLSNISSLLSKKGVPESVVPKMGSPKREKSISAEAGLHIPDIRQPKSAEEQSVWYKLGTFLNKALQANVEKDDPESWATQMESKEPARPLKSANMPPPAPKVQPNVPEAPMAFEGPPEAKPVEDDNLFSRMAGSFSNAVDKSLFSSEDPEEAWDSPTRRNEPMSSHPMASRTPPQPNMNAEALQQPPSNKPEMMPEMEATNSLIRGNERSQEAQKPGEYTEVGSIESVLKDPESLALYKRVAGKELNQEMLEMAKKYEAAVDSSIHSLDEEERAIRAKIDAGQLSGMDKFFLGLALAAPAIIGLAVGGKEGLLTAAGSSLGGLAKGIEDKEKFELGGRNRIGEIGTEKMELQGSTLEFREKLAKEIPDRELREELAPRLEIIGDKVGISTPSPDLFIAPRAARTQATLDAAEKDYPHVAKTHQDVIVLDAALDEYEKVLEQIGKMKNGARILGGASPWFRDQVEVKGQLVDAHTYLEHQRQLIATTYNAVKNLGVLKEATITHFDGILGTPYGFGSWSKGKDVATIMGQLNSFRDQLRDESKEFLVSRGYFSEPLERRFQQSFHNKNAQKKNVEQKALNDLLSNPEAASGQWMEVPD